VQTRVQFLNTVIGKMSGVLGSQSEIAALRLVPTTPADDRAFLVEAFNHILISRIALPVSPDAPPFRRGITAFVEKDDLLPFEHAKLYGHNATHALAAYLGALMNCTRIAELPAVPGMLDFLRRAFVEESGAALIHRYHDLDPLFTPAGYAAYADDLLVRMCNPYLADTIERVGRDVERKLGWDDRLVGTMRLALAAGVTPRRYALGAAAALVALDPALLTDSAAVSERLVPLWGNSLRDPAQEQAVLALVAEGLDRIRRWHAAHGDSQSLLATF
jgi:mannitol-1-phosphate 5-dehydrogenase